MINPDFTLLPHNPCEGVPVNLVYFPIPIGVGESAFDYVSLEPGTYTISFDLVGVEGQLEVGGNAPATIGWKQGQGYFFLPIDFTQFKRIDTGELVWDDAQPITQRVYCTFTFDLHPITQVSIALLSEFITAGQIDNVWMLRGTIPY